jgi:hypothetical protein
LRTRLAFFALLAGMLAATGRTPTISTSAGLSEIQPALLGSNPIPAPSPSILRQPDLGPKPHGWLDAGSHQSSLIYVAAENEVLIFPESGYNSGHIGAITDGVSCEANEHLYVSNFLNTKVYISPYPPGEFQLKLRAYVGRIQGMALSNEEQ